MNIQNTLALIGSILAIITGTAEVIYLFNKRIVKKALDIKLGDYPSLEGTVLNFNPQKKSYLDHFREGSVIKSPSWYPVFLYGKSISDPVIIAPYFIIEKRKIEKFPPEDECNSFYYEGKGAGGIRRHFIGVLSPDMDHFTYGPLYDRVKQEMPGFITLKEGEVEEWVLNIQYVPGYIYTFRIGFVYTFKGKQSIKWVKEIFTVGNPQKARIWLLHDWPKFEFSTYKCNGPVPMGWASKVKRHEAYTFLENYKKHVFGVPGFNLRLK